MFTAILLNEMNEKMKYIRPALAEDASRIAEIIVTNYRLNFYHFFNNDLYYYGKLNVVKMAAEYSENSRELGNSYVYDDGVIKGVIRVSEHEIEKLYVEPQFQSEGIGTELLKFAVNELNASELWALEYNTRGISFYQKNGFIMTGEKKMEDEWIPLLKMIRSE